MKVRAVEDCDLGGAIAVESFIDAVGDPEGFVFAIQRFVKADFGTGGLFGPEGFALALSVVGDNGTGRLDDVFGGAVVLLKTNDFCVAVVALEIEDVADVGTPPRVNRLVFITDGDDVAVAVAEQAHEFILAAVGVLVFIDHHVSVTTAVQLAQGSVVTQQADALEQQIVEIDGIGLTQTGFVLFVDHRHAGGLGIFGVFVEVLRTLMVALGMADAGERRTVLHELFVETEALEDLFDQRQLVVVVVNIELPGEAVADIGETVAIAAQHSDTKRMKGRDEGHVIVFAGIAQQLMHAFFHFFGGFIGKGHCQNCVAGHFVGMNEVGHAVRDDACLAGSSTSQDQ